MAYIGTTPTKVVSRQSVVDYRYTATEGQTAFTGADLNNQVLACNPADMDVYLNGVRLDLTDWSATATALTLAVGATAGDEVTVAVRQTFEVADTYAKTTADDRFVNAAGDTLTGTLNLPDDTAMIRRASNAEWVMGFDATNNILSIGTQGGATANRLQLCSGGNKIAIEADGSGRVTMPYQPMFEVYRSGDQSISAITPTQVGLNAASVNVGGHFDTNTNSRFTAPVYGQYLFYGTVHYGAISASHSNIKVNGAYVVDGWVDFGDALSSTQTRLLRLNAGDYVELWGYSSVATVFSGSRTKFGGYLIG